MAPPAPAAWYPDPKDPAALRWWDGTQWTRHTQPSGSPAASSATPTRRPSRRERKKQAASFEDISEQLPRLRAELSGLLELKSARDALHELQSRTERLRREVPGLQDLSEVNDRHRTLTAEVEQLTRQRDRLAAEIVELDDHRVLQEVGIYEYHHVLEDAVAYRAELKDLQNRIKSLARNGKAISTATSWQVDGSAAKGKRMLKDFSKLLLRAYNNEADTCVRTLRPYSAHTSVQRLGKARDTISRLGVTMNIAVTPAYHALRVRELELTADYLAKQAEEKERIREERERAREEARAAKEIEREQAKLNKELEHRERVLERLRSDPDVDAGELAAAEASAAETADALKGLIERAANTRAGYVYVISNIGAFGPGVVKVGMTRRLEPMDRVRELGDASVPFRFDVHALIFSNDAVGLEAELHRGLDEKRVNLVNQRREFFYASPAEVRELLADGKANVLEFVEEPEALEWHQSENSRAGSAENSL